MKSFVKHSGFKLKLGILLLLLVVAFGLILPLFGERNPEYWNTYVLNLKPSSEHLFGTNAIGQDIFWLLAKSIQTSLIIGLIVAFVSSIIGIFLGMLAGFRGGITDRIISLFTDTLIVIPSLPILILLGSLFKGRATILVIASILVLFSWPWPARQVRAMSLSLRERDFIDTARFSGENQIKILLKEILPFLFSWSVASFINAILAAIRAETSMAIIGMSNSAWATLGTMIYWAIKYQAMLKERWLWILAPVVATVIIFVALYMTLSGVQKYNALKRGREI